MKLIKTKNFNQKLIVDTLNLFQELHYITDCFTG